MFCLASSHSTEVHLLALKTIQKKFPKRSEISYAKCLIAVLAVETTGAMCLSLLAVSLPNGHHIKTMVHLLQIVVQSLSKTMEEDDKIHCI